MSQRGSSLKREQPEGDRQSKVWRDIVQHVQRHHIFRLRGAYYSVSEVFLEELCLEGDFVVDPETETGSRLEGETQETVVGRGDKLRYLV